MANTSGTDDFEHKFLENVAATLGVPYAALSENYKRCAQADEIEHWSRLVEWERQAKPIYDEMQRNVRQRLMAPMYFETVMAFHGIPRGMQP